MTFVLPKDFSMFWKETEAIVRYQRSEVRYQTQHGSRAPVVLRNREGVEFVRYQRSEVRYQRSMARERRWARIERADFLRNGEGVECHEGILAPRRIFA